MKYFKLSEFDSPDAPGSGEESGDEQPGESDSSDNETEDGEGEVEPQAQGETIDSEDGGEIDTDPFKVETDEAFTDGAQSLTDTNLGSRGPEYYQVPKVNLDEIIAPNLRFTKSFVPHLS